MVIISLARETYLLNIVKRLMDKGILVVNEVTLELFNPIVVTKKGSTIKENQEGFLDVITKDEISNEKVIE